jgi:hypothetical protein
MTRCKNDLSRRDRFVSYSNVAETRLRQEMLRLINGIKVVDGLWKGSDRVLVFLRSKCENNSAAHSGYAMNFSEVSERIVPEIQSVHRVGAIEGFAWIRNPIAACTLYLDQALRDRVAIMTLSHLHHSRRDVDAGYESFGRKLCHSRERPAVAEANLKNPRAILQFQQIEHPSVYVYGLHCHYPREQTPEKARRMACLPRDEFRTAQEVYPPAG